MFSNAIAKIRITMLYWEMKTIGNHETRYKRTGYKWFCYKYGMPYYRALFDQRN